MDIIKPELLAPGGSLEKLKYAIHYGADAVYIGGQQYGLRSSADNFTIDEMAEAVQFASGYGAKVFVAANIYAHNEDLAGIEEYLCGIQQAGIAAIIAADPAIITTCLRVAPRMEVHLSTQQSTMNWKTVQFWKEQGIHRVVLAREASMQDIIEIKKKVHIEIETFIHGAMCSSFSGRCVLSNHFTDRDSNRGGCSQSCRWKYHLHQEGKMHPLFELEDDLFTMGSKDLNMIRHIPQMIQSGVESFKIEGRMKSIHYVSTVVNAYRKAIDAYCQNPDEYEVKQEWIDEIEKAANRPLSSGFFFKSPSHDDHIYKEETKITSYDFAGLVVSYDESEQIAVVQQRNHFKVGQEIEFFGPHGTSFQQTIDAIWDTEGNSLTAARHPMQEIRMKVHFPVRAQDMMRKKVE